MHTNCTAGDESYRVEPNAMLLLLVFSLDWGVSKLNFGDELPVCGTILQLNSDIINVGFKQQVLQT